MNIRLNLPLLAIAGAVAIGAPAYTQGPSVIDAPGETIIAKLHAEGAQIYECKRDAGGMLAWQFREPIATLLLDGVTVGRHYAGPSWDHSDGSGITAKAVADAPGKTARDIPWLKLEVTAHHGNGALSKVTTVQRINTQAGVIKDSCAKAGAYATTPYSADYIFLQKGM